MNKSHLYIKNNWGESLVFNHSRNVDNDREDSQGGQFYRRQKNTLMNCLNNYHHDIDVRRANRLRTLDITHIEYVKISFLRIFDDSMKSKFAQDFGMLTVSKSNFNQDVLFAIVDNSRFEQTFLHLVSTYWESQENEVPAQCKVLTLICEFELLTTEKIIGSFAQVSGDFVLRFVDDFGIVSKYSKIKSSLVDFLCKEKIIHSDQDVFITISNLRNEQLRYLLNNYDIIQSVQSLRTKHVKHDVIHGFQYLTGIIVNVPEDIPTIGVIDTGAVREDCLESVLTPEGIDITGENNPFIIHSDHGITVSSLASFGHDYFCKEEGEPLNADARVFTIKALAGEVGSIDISTLREAIISAHLKYGIRIFNLSMVNNANKRYNEGISEYAYMLDKLSYDYDLLFFISTGNIDVEDVSSMEDIRRDPNTLADEKQFLAYPNHFYDPSFTQGLFVCESTNICSPAESMNNVTVGAIAYNGHDESQTDLTLSAYLPAYYSRKYNIDYNGLINNTRFKNNQKNKNIFKPDIVMPGGDLLSPESRMQIICRNDSGLGYDKMSGTSFSAPLAANLAAKIVRLYPQIKMQTVKGLLINSSCAISPNYLEQMMHRLKLKENSQYDQLSGPDKSALTKKYNPDRLNKYLSGYGIPNISECMFSDDGSVTMIVEETILPRSHKVVNLNIPHYLNEKHSRSAVIISATLCFRVDPVFNDSLSYNPVHISFNFGNSICTDDEMENAKFYANSTAAERGSEMAIKSNFGPWSDDFFPNSSKLFSNVQKMSINLSSNELEKINNQMCIIVRCTGRTTPELLSKVEIPHDFSLVISIKETQKQVENSLYDQLIAVNSIEAITELNAEGRIEL